MSNQFLKSIIPLSIAMILSACLPDASEIPTTSATASSVETSTAIIPSPTPADYPSPLGEGAVFTVYFYWYDNGGSLYPDPTNPFRDFPITSPEMTFRGTEWHRRQVEDMIYAGVDVILPVFWSDNASMWWARPGLENLVDALYEMQRDGIEPLPIAMFYDTNSLSGVDVRTQQGRNWAYQGIDFFYRTVPRWFWAVTEGNRPIIWFYNSGPLGGPDQGFVDDVYQQFEDQFGVRPYLVLDKDWIVHGIPISYDATASYAGGAADFTAKVSIVSPGADDRLLEVVTDHTFVDRQDGDFYKNGLVKAILCGTPWLELVSWNEFFEATDISETIQYGRTYLDITHEYVEYFKRGNLPADIGIISAYKDAQQISIELGETNIEYGITLLPNGGDSQHQPVVRGGEAARENITGYMYFQVDDGFYFAQSQPIELSIRYFDQGYEPIYLEYDAAPCASDWNVDTMYHMAALMNRTNTLTWKIVRAELFDATFSGHENGFSDFRIYTPNEPLAVNEVTITKLP